MRRNHDKAPAAERAIIGTAGALVTLVVVNLNDWLKKILAPWFSFKVVKRKYQPMFPCTPVGLGPGRQAQEVVSSRCRSFSADQWGRASVRELLEKVAAAISAGEYHGGSNWKCLEPTPDA